MTKFYTLKRIQIDTCRDILYISTIKFTSSSHEQYEYEYEYEYE